MLCPNSGAEHHQVWTGVWTMDVRTVVILVCRCRSISPDRDVGNGKGTAGVWGLGVAGKPLYPPLTFPVNLKLSKNSKSFKEKERKLASLTVLPSSRSLDSGQGTVRLPFLVIMGPASLRDWNTSKVCSQLRHFPHCTYCAGTMVWSNVS